MRRIGLAVCGVLIAALTAAGQQTNSAATYTLKPTPKTVAWGYYDASAAPVLRVTGYDVPYPYWQIEDGYMPSVARVADACRRVLAA